MARARYTNQPYKPFDKRGYPRNIKVKTCKECGAEFQPSNGLQKFCSPHCARAASWVDKVCPQCDETFRYSRYERTLQKYCTKTCANIATASRRAAKMRRPKKVCPQCGEEYQPKKSDQTFCSQKCHGASARFKPRKNTGGWGTRWSLSLKGEKFCRNCGRFASHLHHIVPRSRFPQGKFDVASNGMPLCWQCHMGWHNRDTFIYRDVLRENELQAAIDSVGEWWVDKNYPKRPDVELRERWCIDNGIDPARQDEFHYRPTDKTAPLFSREIA